MVTKLEHNTTYNELEKRLEESEKRIRLHLQQTLFGVIEWNLKFEVIEWNPAAEKIFGFTKGEALGRHAASLIVPKSTQLHVDNVWNELLKQAGGTYSTNENVRKDGRIIVCEWFNTPLVNDDGIVTGVASLVQDISERKKAEEDLRAEKDFASRLIETAQAIILVLDTQGRIVRINRFLEELSGYQLSEVKGKDWFTTFLPKRNQHLIRSIFLKAIDDIQTRGNVNTIIAKDGREIYTEWYDKTLKDANGKTIGLISIGLDITERMIAEQKIKEADEIIKRSSSVAFTWKNAEGWPVEYVSDNVEKLFGFNSEEFISGDVLYANCIHPGDLERVAQEVRIFSSEKDRKEFIHEPYRIIAKDNSVKIIDDWTFIVRDSGGDITHYKGIVEDITERKRIVEENKKLEEQLQQAQKMEAIGTLAGGIAHDFNNMLGVITGNISYALSQLNQDEELFEVLSDVQEGARQAQNLTQQLLTFAKGGEPIKKVVKLNQIVKESAEFVSRGTKSSCEFNLANDLWTVEVDPGQLNQVIGNLIINSNQAMPNGGTIAIRTENTEIESEGNLSLPAGRHIKIVIEDQGIGISKKHLPNIFDPYFSTKQKGSGLGLATAYSIIKRHDGHITVYSEIEKGTVFNIYLPASSKDFQEIKDKDDTKHSGSGNILIMDDQESILKMTGRMLNRMGYETVFATDGKKAVELYREAYHSENPFDLVILDLTIPGGMGGTKTIIELLKFDPDVKALVSSGYSNDPIMANYEDYGFCGVVPKPYTKAQLSEVLNKLFDGKE